MVKYKIMNMLHSYIHLIRALHMHCLHWAGRPSRKTTGFLPTI